MTRCLEAGPVPSPFKKLQLMLPDGRVLGHGDEFTVVGEGRFSFRYGWRDTEVTCWGPIGSQYASMRTFDASRINTIHRQRKAHP